MVQAGFPSIIRNSKLHIHCQVLVTPLLLRAASRPGKRQAESSWNVMAHGDAREGRWRGNWRMEWVASTLHTISEHGVSSITTADAHTSAASSRLNWHHRRFKWTRPFRRKTKSGFCACDITFQLASSSNGLTNTWRSMCSLELVMMAGKTVWNM